MIEKNAVAETQLLLDRAVFWLKRYQSDHPLNDDDCEELDALINVTVRAVAETDSRDSSGFPPREVFADPDPAPPAGGR